MVQVCITVSIPSNARARESLSKMVSSKDLKIVLDSQIFHVIFLIERFDLAIS